MKKILVPTDFSEHAENAGNYAVELSRLFEAHITILHIYSLPPASVYPPLYSPGFPGKTLSMEEVQQIEKENEKHLQAFRDTICHGHLAYGCTIAQRSDFVSDGINDYAMENNIDLIIMGTRGSASKGEFFIATTTWDVISSGKTAVLAIPEKAPFKPIDHIAFATDFTEADFASMEVLTKMAGKLNAKVSVIHVKTSEGSLEENQMFDWFEEKTREQNPYPNIEFVLLEHEDVQEALNIFLSENQVGMIALVNRKRQLFERLFHRSLTKKFAYHCNIPLLAFSD
ncbi:MAG: universal stress protein [Bacteroidales bacterium]|jgi:nucleotide-binding universal stress UspA family protein|nr:universal stress protein [Bacteroidales bacterium]NLM93829.1 universal stress protein [Bacteroidales bacterium]